MDWAYDSRCAPEDRLHQLCMHSVCASEEYALGLRAEGRPSLLPADLENMGSAVPVVHACACCRTECRGGPASAAEEFRGEPCLLLRSLCTQIPLCLCSTFDAWLTWLAGQQYWAQQRSCSSWWTCPDHRHSSCRLWPLQRSMLVRCAAASFLALCRCCIQTSFSL